jgi:hypothetical protein
MTLAALYFMAFLYVQFFDHVNRFTPEWKKISAIDMTVDQMPTLPKFLQNKYFS